MNQNMLRCLIITDSLGCPRQQTSVDETWVDIVIKKWSGKKIIFYTYCKYGLSTSDIDINYISRLEPDIIICQIGVVDARRRAFSAFMTKICPKIPYINKVYYYLSHQYHYLLTEKYSVHYASIEKYAEILTKICKSAKIKCAFIGIAGPGKCLSEKTYNIKKDINVYNGRMKQICREYGGVFLNPWSTLEPDCYCLEDGLHLNSSGIGIVVSVVDDFLDCLIKQDM